MLDKKQTHKTNLCSSSLDVKPLLRALLPQLFNHSPGGGEGVLEFCLLHLLAIHPQPNLFCERLSGIEGSSQLLH